MLHFLLPLLYANVRTIASHFSISQIPAITYSAHGRAMELPRARYRALSSVRFLLHTPSLFRNHLQVKNRRSLFFTCLYGSTALIRISTILASVKNNTKNIFAVVTAIAHTKIAIHRDTFPIPQKPFPLVSSTDFI